MERSITLGEGAATGGALRTTRELLAREGLGAALKHGLSRVSRRWVNQVLIPASEAWYGRRLGLDLDGRVATEFSALPGSECNHYQSTPWLTFRRALGHLSLPFEDQVFVDFGCGKGKVLAMAARHPFRRVIGVELCPRLADEARANLERLRPHLRCAQVEVVTADAAAWAIPADVSVAFLYNPFSGSLLSRVLANLRDVAEASERPLHVVFGNPRYLQALSGETRWLHEVARWEHRERWLVYRSGDVASALVGERDAA